MNFVIDFTFTCLLIGSEIFIGNPHKMVPMSGPFVFEKVEISPYMTIRGADGSKLDLIMELPENLHESRVPEVLMYCEDMAKY